MNKKSSPVPNPENPEELSGIKLSKPKEVAAGIPAVVSAVKHVFSEMDVVRGVKALNALNQMKGFDCPGCAWPDPDDERSRLGEYCENGAKAIAEEATTKALRSDFFKKHSIQEMSQWDDYTLGKKGRIAQPMYLPINGTHYEPISWDKAFQKISHHLRLLDSPDEAIFYTSGRTSNEAAFLYQLIVRQYGTNNLPDCSNMCHESSGVALGESLGIGKGSVTLEDFHEAEVIMIIGQNPGTNHPRMLTTLQQAKKNGAIIISINPLAEAGTLSFINPQSVKDVVGGPTPLASYHLPVRINGDLALFQVLNKWLIKAEESEGNILDQDFIQHNCFGFQEYKEHILEIIDEDLLDQAGLTFEEVSNVFNAIKSKRKIITCWAMGLTQHKNSVDTIKEVVNFLLLKGSIGKSGAGTCPVRGHSNVQGDRTMGIFEKPWPWLLDKLDANFNINAPREHGYDVVDSIRAMYEKKAKVFFAMGGNFLSATPDTLYTADALQNCELTVHVSTKMNRSHLITGKEAIILPCIARSDRDMTGGIEQFVSCENSMGVVQSSKGNLKPISDDLLSEPEIICRLADTLFGSSSKIQWLTYTKDYDLIRNDIERTIPGFDNYNKRVRQNGGFYLPNSSRSGAFPTNTNKANFNITHVMPWKLEEGEFLMMTIRSHDQYNTTIYGLNDRYRGIENERRVVLVNPKDIAALGFKKLEIVDLINKDGGRQRIARKFLIIPYDIPRGCVATYFPETNVLVPISKTADKSNTPASKSIIIQMLKNNYD